MSEPTAPLAVLIEDNLMFAMMVEPQLKRLGYRVRTLAPAPDTAEKLAGERPELILVNLTTARVPGPDVVRALRATEALAGVAIVGYAGHVEREYFESGREAGASLVVPNSAIRASLAEVLEKLKRRGEGEPGEA